MRCCSCTRVAVTRSSCSRSSSQGLAVRAHLDSTRATAPSSSRNLSARSMPVRERLTLDSSSLGPISSTSSSAFRTVSSSSSGGKALLMKKVCDLVVRLPASKYHLGAFDRPAGPARSAGSRRRRSPVAESAQQSASPACRSPFQARRWPQAPSPRCCAGAPRVRGAPHCRACRDRPELRFPCDASHWLTRSASRTGERVNDARAGDDFADSRLTTRGARPDPRAARPGGKDCPGQEHRE